MTTHPLVNTASVGDVNNDGILDIIGDATGLNNQVFLGNGDGTFRLGASFQSNDGSNNGTRVVLADVDGDGDLDAVYNTSGIAVALNNGDGTFQAERTYAGTFGIVANLVVGDFNRDGIVDFAGAGQGNNAVSVYMGNGDGSFQAVRNLVYAPSGAAQFQQVQIADVNGDGFEDLVAQRGSNGDFSILYGNGDGSFKAPISTAHPHAQSGWGIAVGDITGDGAMEILSSVFGGPYTTVGFFSQGALETPSIGRVTLATQADARDALATLARQQERIGLERGTIGAIQSRVEIATRQLLSMAETHEAAASRIGAADVAQESAELTRLTILQNTAAALLAQANLQPGLVLNLLREDT